MKSVWIFLTLTTVIIAQDASNSSLPTKTVHVCPKHFVRIGRRCYFFSRNKATWQESIHKCQDKQSNIAIIKTANQDRRIRKILSRPTHAIHERWIGGMYNWRKMKWLWATTGKPLTYQGFQSQNFTQVQKWHCIIMDPAVNYKWNTRPCLERKPYICHTKSKMVVRNTGDDGKHQNEIFLINNEIDLGPASLKEFPRDSGLMNQNDAPIIPSRPKRRRKSKKKRLNNTTILLHRPKYTTLNATGVAHDKNNISMETIKYEIYKEDTKMSNSLYPNPIVEEYSFVQKN